MKQTYATAAQVGTNVKSVTHNWLGPFAVNLCLALDLPIVPKNTESIRSKLKRLVSRGILIETEPGLFARLRP